MKPEWMLLVVFGVIAGSMLMGRIGRASSEEVHKLVKEGAHLLDVRTSGEFSQGHLPGAINVPVSDLAAVERAAGQDKDHPVVVYCRSGARSGRAKRHLQKQGYTKVLDLGPMSAW